VSQALRAGPEDADRRDVGSSQHIGGERRHSGGSQQRERGTIEECERPPACRVEQHVQALDDRSAHSLVVRLNDDQLRPGRVTVRSWHYQELGTSGTHVSTSRVRRT
jgi:hypothetical protein